jgi:hypothetical protein
MRTNTTNFIATIFLAIILSLVLPWWSVMIAALATGLLIPLKKNSRVFYSFFSHSFVLGFL